MSPKAIVTWPPPKLALLEGQLQRLADAVADGGDRNIDDQMWLTRFLVVRCCGYLEQVVHETVVSHLEQASYGTARSFVMSWLDRSRTPSPDNLLNLVGRLDSNIQLELLQLLEDDEKRLLQDLALLVGRRHQIAHGENEGMTSQTALKMVKVVKEIANWFIVRLDPVTPSSHRQNP